MLDSNKTDFKMGEKVREYLISKGVETPFIENKMLNSEKIETIEKLFSQIMEVVGLNLTDDSLQDTPKRVAKMYLNEIFWGMRPENFPKCTTVENKMNYDEMVIENNINVQSNCEHHFVVIDGKATVAYIPRKKVLGLSKINRIVEYFSKRPQIQERLTEQIFHCLQYILETEDIAVLIKAQHYCVKSRGVEDINSYTTTSKLGGKFKTESDLRNEFITLIKK